MTKSEEIKTGLIYRGDCHSVLKREFPSNCIDLIYIDPPFSFDPEYAKLWYDKETLEMFEEIKEGGPEHYTAWISKRLKQCHRILKPTGSIYLHCDRKFNAHLRLAMDDIFGRNSFQNEVIWSYKTGGVSKKRHPSKHDNILFYTKTKKYTFNPQKEKSYLKHKYGFRNIEIKEDEKGFYREVYVRDVWDIPALRGNQPEVLGYPTQKPEALLGRIILSSSNENDLVLDPMCGCGTTIATAHKLRRKWIGIDVSSTACEKMKERMMGLEGIADVPVIGLPLTTKDLKELNPFEFQDYICEMVGAEKRVHVGDLGIDGEYKDEYPLQIKQQERVGRNVVDNFETALRRAGKNKGYVIAFSFTRGASGAYEEVARAKKDGLEIRLVKIDELITNDYELEKEENND